MAARCPDRAGSINSVVLKREIGTDHCAHALILKGGPRGSGLRRKDSIICIGAPQCVQIQVDVVVLGASLPEVSGPWVMAFLF